MNIYYCYCDQHCDQLNFMFKMGKKKKQLDTSVVVTYQDGRVKTFDSIEKASKATGISVPAIRIRCGKKTKEKISFEWANEYTKQYYRAKKNRKKGSNFEYQIIDKLKSIGYGNVCRSAGESKHLDNQGVDIADPSRELDVAIQAKNQRNTPNYFKLSAECKDKREFCLLWHKSDENNKAVAIISIDFFYELLKTWHKQK